MLVVDETVLLPHMSIPYPIEDDESAMVIDRATRMPMRQVLVLTERIVHEPAARAPESEFAPIFADLQRGEASSSNGEDGRLDAGAARRGVQFEL